MERRELLERAGRVFVMVVSTDTETLRTAS
jgi:hypothetical protein